MYDSREDKFEEPDIIIGVTVRFPGLEVESQYMQEIGIFSGAQALTVEVLMHQVQVLGTQEKQARVGLRQQGSCCAGSAARSSAVAPIPGSTGPCPTCSDARPWQAGWLKAGGNRVVRGYRRRGPIDCSCRRSGRRYRTQRPLIASAHRNACNPVG